MGRPYLFNSFVVKGSHAYLFLTQGKKTVIDRDDLEKALSRRWYAHRCGYNFYAATTDTHLHAFLTGFKETDHIDGDGLNNLRSNLRDGSNGVNQRNKEVTNATSGYRGVYFHKQRRKWQAMISVQGKQIHLGLYSTREEGARAYDEASNRFY